MPEASVPSGEQVELEHGEQRVTVVEIGGGLRTYSAGEREILSGYGLGAPSSSGRGQVLAPWPNRLEDGSYEFDGERHQLAITEAECHNAIHGLVRKVAWRVAEREPSRAVMEHAIDHEPGYPFSLVLRIEYALSDDGLRVRATAANLGDRACPYGIGAHPYLTVGTPTVDSAHLRLPARSVMVSDERALPRGSRAVEGTAYDFRRSRPIGSTVLDDCFGDLERDGDGIARVQLSDPQSGAAVALWVDESYPYLMVFTGDPLPDVARRSLAVEPMTCPANAFRSGTSLIRLEPGASFVSTWGISPHL